VVPLLVATACGGGPATRRANGPSPSPSITVPGLVSSTSAVPAAYLDRVDAGCASSLDALRRRGPAPAVPADPHRLTAAQLHAAAPYLQAGADIQRQASAAVAGFAAPSVGAGAWAVFRTAVAQFAAGTQAEASEAARGDVAGFLAAAQRLLALRTKVLESGLAVGLGPGTACARLF
jgi:hypothetical protein